MQIEIYNRQLTDLTETQQNKVEELMIMHGEEMTRATLSCLPSHLYPSFDARERDAKSIVGSKIMEVVEFRYYEGKENLSSYLCSVVRNAVKKSKKKAIKRNATNVNARSRQISTINVSPEMWDILEGKLATSPGATAYTDEMDYIELERVVDDITVGLKSDFQRSVLIYLYWYQKDVETIARLLNSNKRSIRSTIVKLKKILKAEFHKRSNM